MTISQEFSGLFRLNGSVTYIGVLHVICVDHDPFSLPPRVQQWDFPKPSGILPSSVRSECFCDIFNFFPCVFSYQLNYSNHNNASNFAELLNHSYLAGVFRNKNYRAAYNLHLGTFVKVEKTIANIIVYYNCGSSKLLSNQTRI